MTITHGLWAYAPNGTIEKTGSRPDWRVGDDQETSSVAPDDVLIGEGWFPVVDGDGAFDAETQTRTLRPSTEWSLEDERVVRTWIVESIPVYPPTSADVNAERDRRMVAGFDFQGVRFQSRPEDRENIMGAFALASTALTVGGKQPGDLRWHGGESDFVFIAEDNSRVPMDAIAVLGLGQAAAAQKSALTFAANDLKKLDPVPADFDNDQWWP